MFTELAIPTQPNSSAMKAVRFKKEPTFSYRRPNLLLVLVWVSKSAFSASSMGCSFSSNAVKSALG